MENLIQQQAAKLNRMEGALLALFDVYKALRPTDQAAGIAIACEHEQTLVFLLISDYLERVMEGHEGAMRVLG